MLGALIRTDHVLTGPIAGLDAMVFSGPVPYGQLHALRQAGTATLALVALADEVAPARVAGFDGVLAAADSDLDSVEGVDAVLSDRGRARLVTSPEAARQAFAAGADLVIYDLSAIASRALGSLQEGRPVERARTGREPFLLLSGMLGDASLWDGVSAQLADVVLPWPARIDLDDSVPEMAASVLAEAPPRFTLGGHSLGAIVALEIMRQAPERVRRLVLLNASARGPVEAQQDAWNRWRQRTADGEFDRIAMELAVATLAASRRDDRAVVEANVRMARAVGADGFLRQLTAQTTRPDSRDSVAAIGVPVLVVSGELDEVCPPFLQREIVEHCPRAKLVSIEGAGHMLPLESPDALSEHLRTWLASDGHQ